jgi:hypothetical protein
MLLFVYIGHKTVYTVPVPGMSSNNAVHYDVQHLLFQELTVAENCFQKLVANSKRIWHSAATKLNIPTACEQL